MYSLGQYILEIVNSLKRKVLSLIWRKKSTINIDVFSNPEKYLICLPIEEIIADTKVSSKAIELYKQKIKNKEKIPPIIVVKHPKYDVYAVLDGHHRYYAYLEMGRKEIECALAGDFSTVIFYLIEQASSNQTPKSKARCENQSSNYMKTSKISSKTS